MAYRSGANDHRGLSHGGAKKLSSALLYVARQGATTHPILSNLFLARNLNHLCGTSINPWEIDQLPDEWLDAITAVNSGLHEMQNGLAQVKQAQDRIRARYGRK